MCSFDTAGKNVLVFVQALRGVMTSAQETHKYQKAPSAQRKGLWIIS